MASEGETADQELQRLAQDHGTCTVCLELAKDHRALPCQHVFCLECVKPLVHNNKIKCPTCQSQMELKQRSVELLPKNLFLNSIIAKFCEKCMKNRREIHCHHCTLWLCNLCHGTCRNSIDLEVKDLSMRSESIQSRHPEFVLNIEEAKMQNLLDAARLSRKMQEHTDLLVKELRKEEQKLQENLKSKTKSNEKSLDTLLRYVHDLRVQLSCNQCVLKTDPTSLNDYNDIAKTCEGWRRILKDESWMKFKDVNGISFVPRRDSLKCPVGTLDIDVQGQSARSLIGLMVGNTTSQVIGGEGSEPGELNCPSHVAISPVTGHIFVVDSENDRIQVFTCEGRLVRMFGSRGRGREEFMLDEMSGVTVTDNGNVIISDTCNHRIKICSEQGVFLRLFIRAPSNRIFNFLCGLTCNTNGIYICDGDDYQIHILRLDGTLTKTFPTVGMKPWDVASCPNGDILVVGRGFSGELRVYSSAGELKAQYCLGEPGSVALAKPFGVAVKNTGEIVVADAESHQVHVLTKDGRLIRTIGSEGSEPGEFMNPVGVACTGDGRIVVADQGNDRLHIFNLQ